MLEGGNEQLQRFYARHGMGEDSCASNHRYQTKAARFYRRHLDIHVEKVGSNGAYGGRAASRAAATTAKSIPDVAAVVERKGSPAEQRPVTVQVSVR